MKYSEIVRHINVTAATNEDGAQDALELVVENVAAYLPPQVRMQFAAGLPLELQSAAQMLPAVRHMDEDIVEQLMQQDGTDETNARRRIRAAWQALRPAFNTHEVQAFTTQLPRNVAAALE
jgi:uncharacterized protein (DUF2267 family)